MIECLKELNYKISNNKLIFKIFQDFLYKFNVLNKKTVLKDNN